LLVIVFGAAPCFSFLLDRFLSCISTLCFGGRLPGESRDYDTHDTIEALVLDRFLIVAM
jgi:hypothetical protein